MYVASTWKQICLSPFLTVLLIFLEEHSFLHDIVCVSARCSQVRVNSEVFDRKQLYYCCVRLPYTGVFPSFLLIDTLLP